MLIKLFIQNYALIRYLEISPSQHLNIITGETGAGKSIMIGAVSLLLGKRADIKSLYNKEEKCIVEGVFNVTEYQLEPLFEELDLDFNPETIIRREITPGGKSRAFINDTPVNLEVMKQIGAFLMDVHSQHDTLLLGSLDYQLSVVDTFAQNSQLLLEYITSYNLFRHYKSELEYLELESAHLKKEADYNHFLFEELKSAQLKPEEQEELEDELNKLEHAEEIKSGIFEVINLLQEGEMSTLEVLAVINKKLDSLSSISTKFNSYQTRFGEVYLEIKDLAREIEKESEKIEHNPELANEFNDRLNLIYKLQQKHQATNNTQLLAIQDGLEDKVNRTTSLESEIDSLRKKADSTYEILLSLGEKLSDSRVAIFDSIRHKLEEMLKSLGIPEAKISITNNKTQPHENGIDQIEILFSANKGIAPMNLKQVASGGEFSRLMFCIKYIIASKKALPTLILDEIDTGISGEIALKMAKLMKEMAENHQVVVITHLPQIASAGLKHYFVYKDNSAEKSMSLIREIDKDERIIEIAKMIGGDQPSTAAIDNARELLEYTYIN